MPAWWRKRSSRSKDSESENENSVKGSSIENEKKIWKEISKKKDNKAKSFDEVSVMILRQKQSKNSPRNSRDYAALGREEGGGSSRFDSASSLDIGHPLLRPFESSTEHV
ncbi:mitogen-activated protein kinase kinase kinase 3-like [Abeliophyllum distichum]|uniref:Mitogen-activated protein kinase kinase kinase 3-like n=1 Tax=Abeliophyllum distichum TaxID=126358 RepID=A0ABD1SX54_9LAMI